MKCGIHLDLAAAPPNEWVPLLTGMLQHFATSARAIGIDIEARRLYRTGIVVPEAGLGFGLQACGTPMPPSTAASGKTRP